MPVTAAGAVQSTVMVAPLALAAIGALLGSRRVKSSKVISPRPSAAVVNSMLNKGYVPAPVMGYEGDPTVEALMLSVPTPSSNTKKFAFAAVNGNSSETSAFTAVTASGKLTTAL